MKIFHRMFTNLENPENKEKEDLKSEALKKEGYELILDWEEYGMSNEDHQAAIKREKPFIPVTAIFYRDPKTGWNLMHQKIKYDLSDGVPQPNFDYVKSIAKVAGPSVKHIKIPKTRGPGH